MPAYRAPGTTWTSELTGAPSGQTASWTVALLNGDTDAVVIAATNTGVAETDAPSGNYKKTFTLPTTTGRYKAEWVNGSTKVIDQETVEVTYSAPSASSPLGSDLCTVADVRAAEEAPSADTARDSLVQSLITAASDAIMKEVEREFAPATTSATRRLRVDGYTLSLAPYDLRSVAVATLHPESTTPTILVAGSDYELLPVGAPLGTYTSVRFSSYLANLLTSDTAFRMGNALIDINGAWGFASVPTLANRACVLTVLAWVRRDISAMGLSNEFDGHPTTSPTAFGIPYEARRLLASYYRLRALAF